MVHRVIRPTRLPIVLLTLLALLVAIPSAALGHAERATFYPERSVGEVPEPRTTGRTLIVCKSDSAKRIRSSWKGKGAKRTKQRRAVSKLVSKCRFRHLQQAVDAATTGSRILMLPGVYREEPSRAQPVKAEKCQGPGYWESSGDNHQEDGRVPTYLHQVDCPNSRNLVAIIGDSVKDLSLIHI